MRNNRMCVQSSESNSEKPLTAFTDEHAVQYKLASISSYCEASVSDFLFELKGNLKLLWKLRIYSSLVVLSAS